MDRKRFITSGLAGGSLLLLPNSLFSRISTHSNLNILMLGGTNYVGPAIVRESLNRGHNVTLFNRGITDPDLFPNLELIKGNRYPDRGPGLSGLQTNRKWDAVIDTWSKEPGCVDATARLLKDRTASYVYISSIATYLNYKKVNMTESGPLINASDYMDSFDSELGYSVRKRASEQVVENNYPSRGAVLRCTSILGFDGGRKDPTSQSAASYWGFRFLSGKPILVPDDPTAVTQIIDVKDVASFTIRTIENSLNGAYNLVGLEEPVPFLEYLQTWKEVTRSTSDIVRAERDFLNEHQIRPFADIPSWIPLDEREPGFYQISNKRSLNNGLTYRSLEETIEDILPTLMGSNLESISTGLDRKRELELLKQWRNREE